MSKPEKRLPEELPGMPLLDELGNAAYAYKLSCLQLDEASAKKSFCAEVLIKALQKSGKRKIRIDNAIFFHRRAKDCIVEKRVSGRNNGSV